MTCKISLSVPWLLVAPINKLIISPTPLSLGVKLKIPVNGLIGEIASVSIADNPSTEKEVGLLLAVIV